MLHTGTTEDSRDLDELDWGSVACVSVYRCIGRGCAAYLAESIFAVFQIFQGCWSRAP